MPTAAQTRRSAQPVREIQLGKHARVTIDCAFTVASKKQPKKASAPERFAGHAIHHAGRVWNRDLLPALFAASAKVELVDHDALLSRLRYIQRLPIFAPAEGKISQRRARRLPRRATGDRIETESSSRAHGGNSAAVRRDRNHSIGRIALGRDGGCLAVRQGHDEQTWPLPRSLPSTAMRSPPGNQRMRI